MNTFGARTKKYDIICLLMQRSFLIIEVQCMRWVLNYWVLFIIYLLFFFFQKCTFANVMCARINMFLITIEKCLWLYLYVQKLQEIFTENQYPSSGVKKSLSEELGLSAKQVYSSSSFIPLSLSLNAQIILLSCVLCRLISGLRNHGVGKEFLPWNPILQTLRHLFLIVKLIF